MVKYLITYVCMSIRYKSSNNNTNIYVYKQIEVQLLTVTTNDPTTLFNKIDEYLIYRLNQLKQEFSNQTYSIKCRILRNHRYSLPMKVYIDISPEPYLDPMNNPFTSLQWHLLCLGETKQINEKIFILYNSIQVQIIYDWIKV